MVETWDTSVGMVQAWMDANSTFPDLDQLVYSLVINFKAGQEVELHTDILYDEVKRVFEAHRRIGWRLILDGCLTGEWAECQQRYLVWICSRKSGQKWAAGLICKLWEVEWNAWMHRNYVLHDTPLAEEMRGSLALDKVLGREWTVGFSIFPGMVKALLPRNISGVLKGGPDERKGWLVLVRIR